MTVRGARDKIEQQVLIWDGVTAHPHRFGGAEYRLGRREIGHIHGDYLVDIPFPSTVRNAVIEAGEAQPHHVLPNSGWVSFYIREPGDVDRAIELLKRSFDLASRQRIKKST